MGTVHFSVSLAQPVKMYKALMLIFALAVAASQAPRLGNNYRYNSGYNNGYDLGNSYDNYGSYNLGYNNNYGYNYGYQQRTIHKRSPFKRDSPSSFSPSLDKVTP